MAQENTKVNDNITIDNIENMKRGFVEQISIETIKLKDFDLFFLNLGCCFGFSCVVFYNDMQMKYLNKYELHYRNKTKEQLKEKYIKFLTAEIFTEKELYTMPKDYTELQSKHHFLHNHYTATIPNKSAFCIIRNKQDQEQREKELAGLLYNPIGFCYYENTESNKNFIDKCIKIELELERQEKELENNFDYLVDAFKYEMFNHEYGINWQADYDIISCFADVDNVKNYESFSELAKAANFTDLQIKAYKKAVKEYYEECGEL